MATKARQQARKSIVIPTPRLVEDALALAGRYKEIEALRRYAAERRPLLQGASAAFLFIGLACGAGVFAFLASVGGWMTLPAMMLAPLVALCSLFVIFYIFYSWVEARALAGALGHRTNRALAVESWLRRKANIDLLARPDVPWIAAGLLVALPLGLLVAAAPLVGVAVLLLAIASPLVYARMDAA
ncbi:MAG TPA: hypothetical protein VFC18_04325 [Burkholderiales bacterium]|nr:hypothetical protein [Burkholderiales bacterium]